MPTNQPVLVTGASGFIAIHCIIQLLEQGYRVRGVWPEAPLGPDSDAAPVPGYFGRAGPRRNEKNRLELSPGRGRAVADHLVEAKLDLLDANVARA